MRLTAIKLAGFKSFVDPTTITLPSNLMGVVGPNGCGKSNIIDAVRWVMGEISARQLRGESMSDVIFSGSSARKPVTTATVELIFDNRDGRAGGEYARFNEISVRRQVSRDGQSSYFLNGSRCRRKDITDLFLGTGLGPRSYAIIEQGMISQIVEARPEDLRAFLEEAAGVSLYKERRRETENRIRHTRENLERLSDLRDEVAKHLDKLKRQARAAERYRKLKRHYREEEARLNALRWRQASTGLAAQAAELKRTETEVEQTVAAQRAAEKALEALRQQQHQASEKTSAVQAELYEVAGEIARIEQGIEHRRELLARQRSEFGEVESQIDELKQHLLLDRAQVDEVTGALAELEPAMEQARAGEQAARERFEAAEQRQVAGQERLQGDRSRAGEARQQTELLKLRIEHLDERMRRAGQQLESLSNDDNESRTRLEQEIEATDAELTAAQAKLEADEEAFSRLRRDAEAIRSEIERLQAEIETQRGNRSEFRGRLESLTVLNQAQNSDAGLDDWLQAQGLDRAPLLLEALTVRPRWRRAAETVLDAWLNARMAPAPLPRALPKSGSLALVVDSQSPATAGTLAEQVENAGALTGWLARIRCVEDADRARAEAANLAPGESIITPEGLWLGPGWIKRQAELDEAGGRLARQVQIRDLSESIQRLDANLAAQQNELESARAALESIVAAQDQKQTELTAHRARVAELKGLLAGLHHRREALAHQRQVNAELRDRLDKRQREDAEALSHARKSLQRAMAELEQIDREEQTSAQALGELRQQRDDQLARFREAREAREQVALKLESARASLNSLKQAIARMDTQIGQLQSRYVELSEALAQGDKPVRELQTQRDELLARRLEIETRLKQARAASEALETEWRDRDAERQRAGNQAEHLRQRQSEQRIRMREIELEAERYRNRVAELDGDLDSLAAELPDDAEAQQWVEELERLEEKIRRLEPVNLAAIDEFEQESERKEYLDSQHADLTEALETLEQAIARIDRTTRTRFKDTFERVNANLETLFPRLFGGGHAHIEMVGDDWLTAGAAILARPPGKRISRIHLLSGGEKALTAVAFVFAIFNLNPAPFCLLDEVDAPLDDANVGRFSELVREMSDRVQFLFVTHNKVTMEVAHQMLGVTMREPGISRLVSVDLDKAVAMAAS